MTKNIVLVASQPGVRVASQLGVRDASQLGVRDASQLGIRDASQLGVRDASQLGLQRTQQRERPLRGRSRCRAFAKPKRKQKRNGRSNLPGALRTPLAGSPTCVFVFVFVLIYVEFEFSESTCRPPTRKTNQRTDLLCETKKSKNQSVSQTIDLVVTINSVQKSSKSELSSGTFGHFKVF